MRAARSTCSRYRAFQRLAVELDRELGSDARLAAYDGFHYGVYLDRPVYSLSFAIERERGPAVPRLIAKYMIDQVILSPKRAAELAVLEVLANAYGNAREIGGVVVVRVWQ